MTPKPYLHRYYIDDNYTYTIYEKVAYDFIMPFDYELSDSIHLKEVRLGYGEYIVPLYSGHEQLFNFGHRLLWISQLDIKNNKYERSDEYVSYKTISNKGNEHLNLTFQVECENDDPYVRTFEDVTVSLSKEECYLLAQKLLSLLESSHFRNK